MIGLLWLENVRNFLSSFNGSSDAMRMLVRYYGLGQGVPQDMAEGIKWWSLAASLGDKQAIQVIQFMKKNSKMNQWPEFIEGLKRARDWQQQHISLFIHP